MKLDNRKQVALIWFRKFLSTLILTLLVITIGFSDYFKTPVMGIDKSFYLIAVVVFYIGLFIFNIILKPHYVYFSDNADKIILRYYPTRIFNRKKNSIEIPRQNFISWETEKFLFGTCEMLYLHGKYKSTVAKYPGVSLSALSRKDRERIKAALNVYVKRK